MKYRILSIIIILAMFCLTITGCTAMAYNSLSAEQNEDNDKNNTNAAENIINNIVITENATTEDSLPSSNNTDTIALSDETADSKTDIIKKKDLDSSWDITEDTVISLDGTAATVRGEGAKVSGGTVTITQAGTYVLMGTLTKGQILIDAPKNDLVRIVLNGVNITADKNAAIYAASADKLLIILADGTKNTITDVGSYVYADTEKGEPDAAIFSKCDLTINGTGTLIVNGNFKNGIKTKDDLIIISGTFIINATNNGLHGKDSVTIVDGKFDIKAGNDGIQSSNNEDDTKGWVDIKSGVYNITSAFDGIQAETDLTISSGAFNIITGGGSAKAPIRTDSGMGGGMRPGGFNSSQQTTTNEDARARKV